MQKITKSTTYCGECHECIGISEKDIFTSSKGKKIHWKHLLAVMKKTGLINGICSNMEAAELVEFSISSFRKAATIPFEDAEQLLFGSNRLHEMVTGLPIDFAVLR
jgi:hypothetical protein